MELVAGRFPLSSTPLSASAAKSTIEILVLPIIFLPQFLRCLERSTHRTSVSIHHVETICAPLATLSGSYSSSTFKISSNLSLGIFIVRIFDSSKNSSVSVLKTLQAIIMFTFSLAFSKAIAISL